MWIRVGLDHVPLAPEDPEGVFVVVRQAPDDVRVQVPDRQEVAFAVLLELLALHRVDAAVRGVPHVDVGGLGAFLGLLFGCFLLVLVRFALCYLFVALALSSRLCLAFVVVRLSLLLRLPFLDPEEQPSGVVRPSQLAELDDPHSPREGIELARHERERLGLGILQTAPCQEVMGLFLVAFVLVFAQRRQVVPVVAPAQAAVGGGSRIQGPQDACVRGEQLHSLARIGVGPDDHRQHRADVGPRELGHVPEGRIDSARQVAHHQVETGRR